MVHEAPRRRLWSVVAAVGFLFVGPGAVLYAGWVLVVDRDFFPRSYVVPFAALYLAYAVWLYRLGREELTLRLTRRQWIARLAAVVVFTGAFVVLYAPALLIALGIAAGVDALWRRLRKPSSPPRRARVVLGQLAAFALLFPTANRLYLNHGVFYTFFGPEPPRLMANPLFDVNREGFRGPALAPSVPADAPPPTVMLVGDSVTWGFPYAWRDTFARHLEERLEQQGHPVRLLNAGIPSQSMVQIEARLDELLSYEPDVVVLMVGYQWTRSVEHQERIQAYDGGFVPRTEWVFLPPVIPEILQLGPRMTYRGLSGTMERWNDPEANRFEFGLQLERALRRLRRAGVVVVVANHPALELDERIRERIRLEAESSGSVWVDVAALFSDRSQFSFNDRIHPNREGQRLVADGLAEALEAVLAQAAASP